MRPKTVALLVVALGCGLAASYMTSKLLAERNTEQPEEETVKILVAKTKVPRGTLLKDPEKYFELKDRRKADAPQSYFTDFAQIKDKRMKKDVKADVHISPEDLLDKNTTALLIPDGHGAIGLTVTAASAASFFVYPGDKVDIILTRHGPEFTSQTILRDVLVLTVGASAIRPDGDGPSGAMQANTVTVALKPEDAQKVRLAEKLGELSLLLRKEGDELQASARVTRPDDLLRSGSVPTALPTQPEPKGGEDELPVGLKPKDLKELEKPKTVETKEPKTVETKEPEEKVEEIKPDHTLTVHPGAGAPVKFHYYKQPDGRLTRDDGSEARKPEKKDAKDMKDKEDKDDE